MTMEYDDDQAVFRGVIGVDEAEPLLAWLQGHAAGRIDLSACRHLHPANLQVLMAARATIHAWPTDSGLAMWLESALRQP